MTRSRASHRRGSSDPTPAFTNRDSQRQVFRDALHQRQGPDDYRVLVFHGPGGHGKTWLSEEFRRMLRQEAMPYAALNFDRKHQDGLHHRNPVLAIKALRCQLSDQLGGATFPAFDVVFRHYHERRRTNEPFEQAHGELVSRNLFVKAALAVGDAMTGGGVTVFYDEVQKRLGAKAQKWYAKHARHLLEDLGSLRDEQLRERLIVCFAADLAHHVWGGNANEPAHRVVILLDTYEALLEEQPAKRGESMRRVDGWIRKLVDETPGVLWVITGRDPLRWDTEDGYDAKHYARILRQKSLDGLPVDDARQGLVDAGVHEHRILDRMLEGALMRSGKVHPFYLEVQARLYGRVRADGRLYDSDGKLATELFGGSAQEVIDRFLEYLDPDERRVLRLLALPRHFDRALFEHLHERFLAGVSVTFEEAVQRSLLRESRGGDDTSTTEPRFSMHDLLREHMHRTMQEEQPELSARVHDALFRWHNDLARAHVRSPNSDLTESALQEAAYHKSLAGDEAFVDWCAGEFGRFDQQQLHETIRPLLQRALAALDRLEHDEAAAPSPTESIGARSAGPTRVRLLQRGNLAMLLAAATETEDRDEAEEQFRRALAAFELVTRPFTDAAARMLAGFNARRALAPSGSSTPDSALAILEPALRDYAAARTVDMPEVEQVRKVAQDESAADQSTDPWSTASAVLRELLRFCKLLDAKPGALTELRFAEFLERRGRPDDYDEAMRRFDRVLRDFAGFATSEDLAPVLTAAWEGFGSFLVTRGRALEAEPLLFAAWQHARNSNDPQRAAHKAHSMAQCMLVMGRSSEAELFARQAVDYCATYAGPDHIWTNVATAYLASARSQQGAHTEALASIERVRDSLRRKLGADHPYVGSAEAEFAKIALRAGAARQALASANAGVRITTAAYGAGHLKVGSATAALAAATAAMGDTPRAIELYGEALRILEGSSGYDHYDTLPCFDGLIALLQQRDPGEARRLQTHRDQVARSLRVDLDLRYPDTFEPTREAAAAIVERYREHGSLPPDPSDVRVHLARLPFLPTHAVATFELKTTATPLAKYAIVGLDDEPGIDVIDWTSAPCHRLAERHPLALDDATTLHYSRLFFESLRSNNGRFRIVERVDDIAWQDVLPADIVQKQREQVAALIRPRRILTPSGLLEHIERFVADLNAALRKLARFDASTAAGDASAETLDEIWKIVHAEATRADDGRWQLRVDGQLLVTDGRAAHLRIVDTGPSLRLEAAHEQRSPSPLHDVGRFLGDLFDLHAGVIAGVMAAIEADVEYQHHLFRCITHLDRAGKMNMSADWLLTGRLCMGLRKCAPASPSLDVGSGAES